MKAFLIDPVARTITEVDYDGDYKSIYRLIECQTFTVALINDHTTDDVFVDDDGLLVSGEVHAFQFIGAHQPYAGKGLVVGEPGDEGETMPATTTLEYLQNITHFGMIRMDK